MSLLFLNRRLLDKLQPRIIDVDESVAPRGLLKNDLSIVLSAPTVNRSVARFHLGTQN